jgi:hypothetical protein
MSIVYYIVLTGFVKIYLGATGLIGVVGAGFTAGFATGLGANFPRTSRILGRRTTPVFC